MTPFEINFQNEIEIERQRFANEWLFIWHNINMQNNLVDVDDFRGGRIKVGGIKFQGQIQQIYWHAVDRYLKGKVHEAFRKWKDETLSYPESARLSSLQGTQNLLRSFVAAIVHGATDTDRRLRGNGYPESVPIYNSTGNLVRANAEIMRLTESHRGLLASVPAARLSLFQQIEGFGSRYRGTIAIVACIAAITFGLLKVISH